MGGRRARRLLGALALVVAAVAALAAVAAGKPQVVKVGNLQITVDGGVFPGRLPAHSYAPIGLRAEARLETTDGSHLPAARHLVVEFDKNGYLNTRGLPHCTVGKLANTLTAEARKKCATSLVGFGRAGAEIEFPEQPPFFASGQMLIFNGPSKGGHRQLIFHVYAHVPAPTTFVTTANITKASGAFGTKVEVTIPTIVAGQGSLTFARLVVKKDWKYHGRTENLMLAKCPNGRFVTRGKMTFAGGRAISGKVLRTCTPVG